MDRIIPVVIVVAYIAATIVIGMLYVRRQKNTKTYFVAGRAMPAIMVGALLFGESVAGAGTVGSAATAFKIGLTSVWANWGLAIGCVVFLIFVSKFIYTMGVMKGCMSVPEVFRQFFDTRCRLVMLINIAVVYFIFFSIQAPAAASILSPLLGSPLVPTIIVFAALFVGLAIFGGIQGVAAMNILNSVIMIGGMAIVMFKSVAYVGGFSELYASVPRSYFSVMQPDAWTASAQGLGAAIGCIGSAVLAGAVFSAKSLKSAYKGILSGSVIIPFALIPAVIGIAASVAIPDAPANSALYLMAQKLGPVYSGLISMAVLAAIMDSAGMLLIVTTTLTRDLYKPYFNPNATDKQMMTFARVMAVIIGITGTWFGMGASSILGTLLGAFQIRSIVGLVLLVAALWPRVTKEAAFWSMLVGGVLAAFWFFAGNPFGMQPLWPGAAVTLIILIVMSKLSKDAISPGYAMYMELREKMKLQGAPQETADSGYDTTAAG